MLVWPVAELLQPVAVLLQPMAVLLQPVAEGPLQIHGLRRDGKRLWSEANELKDGTATAQGFSNASMQSLGTTVQHEADC